MYKIKFTKFNIHDKKNTKLSENRNRELSQLCKESFILKQSKTTRANITLHAEQLSVFAQRLLTS